MVKEITILIEDTYVRNLYIAAGMPDLAGDSDADSDVSGTGVFTCCNRPWDHNRVIPTGILMQT